MGSRIDFHNVLVSILGASTVYFQPPSNYRMSYPCIVYSKEPFDINHANNEAYSVFTKYKVTLIDSDPDTTIPEALARLERSRPSMNFVSDQLNHYVFIIFA